MGMVARVKGITVRGVKFICAVAVACLALTWFAPRAAAANCRVSFNTLNFGDYVGTALDSTTTATVKCNTSWTLGLNAGSGKGATVANRAMTNLSTGAELYYSLYENATYSTTWGNTGADEESGTGRETLTVYGQIFANQYPAPGTYTDTITSTGTPTSSSFTVTSTVEANCTVSATSMAFGTYVPTAASTSTSVISVTCTNTTAYEVGLSAGTASGATVTNRSMTLSGGSTLLHYVLAQNSTYSENWGNSSGSWETGTGTGSAQALTVYGKVAAGQYVVPGTYSDTVTATVTY